MLPRFAPDISSTEVASAVKRRGCAIIEALAPASLMDRVQAELEPYLRRTPHGTGSFIGTKTRRACRLIAKSVAVRELVTHPLVLNCMAELFRGECYDYQLHGTQASQVDPGQDTQPLHRDDGVYPFRHPAPPNSVVTIWALTEFTRDNGATHLVPESHLLDDQARPNPARSERADMPRGSLLVFDAATYHGAGANQSADPRIGVILSYSLGWLRQEENQYLAVPPELARTLPRRLRELVGYKNHGYLGHFEGGSPQLALSEVVPQAHAAEDLYGPELEAIPIRRR